VNQQPFFPNGAVTGVGSLPLTDSRAAVQFVAEYSPELPFWPQLPQRSSQEMQLEQAVGEALSLIEPRDGTYGYRIKAGKRTALLRFLAGGPATLTEQNASGFFAFETGWFAGLFPRAKAVKGQMVGPLTLASCLFDGETPLIADPEAAGLLTRYLARLALWQIRRLQRYQRPTLLVVDEPCLALGASHLPLLQWLLERIHATGALAGVHCCAQLVDYALLTRLHADLISFDAYRDLETFAADLSTQEFIRGGGIVAYGLLPTVTTPHKLDISTLFMRWLLTQQPGQHIIPSLRHTIFTATCGLGLLPLEAVQEHFAQAQQLSQLAHEACSGE